MILYRSAIINDERFRSFLLLYNVGEQTYVRSVHCTYGNLGSIHIGKYYAAFSYNDVPNYSEPTTTEFKGK